MSKQLREHQARKTALVKEARALTDLVASQDRDMTDDEVTAFEALRTRIDSASTAIDREAALIADESRIGLATLAAPSVTDNRQGDPLHGFRTMGEFVQAVFQAEKPGKNIDERLLIGGGRNAAAPLATRQPARMAAFLCHPNSHKRSLSSRSARTLCCR